MSGSAWTLPNGGVLGELANVEPWRLFAGGGLRVLSGLICAVCGRPGGDHSGGGCPYFCHVSKALPRR
jgi:hypothetical protein